MTHAGNAPDTLKQRDGNDGGLLCQAGAPIQVLCFPSFRLSFSSWCLLFEHTGQAVQTCKRSTPAVTLSVLDSKDFSSYPLQSSTEEKCNQLEGDRWI